MKKWRDQPSGAASAGAFLVIIGESLCSLGIIAGLFTRFTVASLIVIMIGAIATVHWPQRGFMNWFG